MNCDSSNREAPISFLLINSMPKPLIHRHSAECLDPLGNKSKTCIRHSNNTSYPMADSSQNELSLSDLTLTKPRRKRRGLGAKMLEDTSSKTALTAIESYNHASSLGCSFSQRSSSARDGSRNFGKSRSMIDTSNVSNYSSSRRSFGDASVHEDGSMADNSVCSISSNISSSSRVRCLKGIRRRRSTPATRRWREQCSRLYKEHVLDACPEQQTVLAVTTAAATKIQSCVRRLLLKENKTKQKTISEA